MAWPTERQCKKLTQLMLSSVFTQGEVDATMDWLASADATIEGASERINAACARIAEEKVRRTA